MPRAEVEAMEAAQAAKARGEDDWAVFKAEYERRLAERRERLGRDACASWRSMDGWGRVETEEQWRDVVHRADEDYDGGQFLIDRLGAERYLDPPLMAVLLALRRRLIDEHGAETAAELMMIDLAVLSYYHTLRINGWIGNLAQWFEAQFFDRGSLTTTIPGGGSADRVRGLTVEYIVERIAEQLMPLLDRSNRMMLRNLKALQARQKAPTPSVSIGAAGQVNVGGVQQVNGEGKST